MDTSQQTIRIRSRHINVYGMIYYNAQHCCIMLTTKSGIVTLYDFHSILAFQLFNCDRRVLYPRYLRVLFTVGVAYNSEVLLHRVDYMYFTVNK